MAFSDDELSFWACPPRRVAVGGQGVTESEVIASGQRAEWMERELLPHTVLLAIAQGADRPVVVNHGSGLLLDTGLATMIGTNGHVHDKLLQRQAEDPTTRLFMSGAAGMGFLNISAAPLIGKASKPDLATFAVSREAIEASGKRFLRNKCLGLRHARKGMLGYPIGYAKEALVFREGEAQQRILLAMPVEYSTKTTSSYMMKRTMSSKPHSPMCWDVDASRRDQRSRRLMSGTRRQGRFCKLPGWHRISGWGTKSVRAVHASFINADGSIR